MLGISYILFTAFERVELECRFKKSIILLKVAQNKHIVSLKYDIVLEAEISIAKPSNDAVIIGEAFLDKSN